jgi:hypothetical protein
MLIQVLLVIGGLVEDSDEHDSTIGFNPVVFNPIIFNLVEN